MMKHIADHLRQRLAQQRVGKQAIGMIALHAVQDFLQSEKDVTGYVRYERLFLTGLSHQMKMSLFRDKQALLDFVNQKIQKVGYDHRITKLYFR